MQKPQLFVRPNSWIMTQELSKFPVSYIRCCSETIQRPWGRLLVPVFHLLPTMNPSLFLIHSTSSDWVTTPLYMWAIILVHYRDPYRTSLLTWPLFSEVESLLIFLLVYLNSPKYFMGCSFLSRYQGCFPFCNGEMLNLLFDWNI